MSAVMLRGVGKAYGGGKAATFAALRDVDLDVETGEFWGSALVRDIGPCQVALNRLLALLQNNIEYTGNPIFVGVKHSGMDRSTFVNRPGRIYDVDGGPNAQNAKPDGGELLVRTWSENNFALIEFKDTGIGIEKENLLKVFDPFFTTRQPGQGVGLGLSISYSIIKRHEGSIEAKSDGKNKGASFIIKIPV